MLFEAVMRLVVVKLYIVIFESISRYRESQHQNPSIQLSYAVLLARVCLAHHGPPQRSDGCAYFSPPHPSPPPNRLY